MQRLAQLGTKFSENVLDAGRAYTRSVTDGSTLAGLPSNAVDRAAADAREANLSGWLFKLDQPTYVTIMASAENADGLSATCRANGIAACLSSKQRHSS